MRNIDLLFLDIGGVLAEVDKRSFAQLVGPKKDSLFFDQDFCLLQRGLLKPALFFQKKSRSLDLCPLLLQKAFAAMFTKVDTDLLHRLRVPYLLMSNINEIHFEIFSQQSQLNKFVRKKSLLSFRLGLLKPNPRFFWHAAHLTKFAPKRIKVIDDHEKNIVAAQKAGFQASLCSHPAALRSVLEQENLLA